MKSIIFLLTILSWELAKVTSETCGQPELRRTSMHIYRIADVDATVYHCYYTDQYTYSDITKKCLNAFNIDRSRDVIKQPRKLNNKNVGESVRTKRMNDDRIFDFGFDYSQLDYSGKLNYKNDIYDVNWPVEFTNQPHILKPMDLDISKIGKGLFSDKSNNKDHIYGTNWQMQFTNQPHIHKPIDFDISKIGKGVYFGKPNNKDHIDATNSPVKLAKYAAKANRVQNEILLKSGTVCRYDRGFCYDPRENLNNFAVVWEVSDEKPHLNAENLIEIFSGWVDIWELKNNSFKYLVFQDIQRDQSFALELMERIKLDDKDLWYTDRNGIMVSQESLKPNVPPVQYLNQDYLPLKPKQFVTENILRGCDFQNFPIDFEKIPYQNYILESINLLAIFGLFQKQLLETQKKLVTVSNGNTKKSEINNFEKDIRETKTSLIIKDQKIVEIQNMIKDMLNAISTKDSEVSKLQEKMKQILAQQQDNDEEFSRIKKILVLLQSQLHKLDGNSNERKVNMEFANLENNFTLLEATLIEKNKDIFKALNDNNKLIDDINKSLLDLDGELRKHDIELKKAQKDISDQLFNIELDLAKQKNDIQYQNYTNLMQKENDEKAQDKLELKYNAVLDRLNLQDVEIGKCQNHTKFSQINNEKLLEVVKVDIGKTQDVVKSIEGQIKDLQNKDIVVENKVYEVDQMTIKLKEDIALNRQEFITTLNKNYNDIKLIEQKSEQCRKAVDDIVNLKDKDSDQLQRNLSELQNILFKQNKEILQLQGTLKEINDKLSINEKRFTDGITDCKRYVNEKLQTKDEKITQIENLLITKDREIENLYEHLKKFDEKNKEFENKMNKCQVDTDRKLKEKDDEIKRIQNNLIEKYKKLESEINEIKYHPEVV